VILRAGTANYRDTATASVQDESAWNIWTVPDNYTSDN